MQYLFVADQQKKKVTLAFEVWIQMSRRTSAVSVEWYCDGNEESRREEAQARSKWRIGGVLITLDRSTMLSWTHSVAWPPMITPSTIPHS
jgi:hypothetical protein